MSGPGSAWLEWAYAGFTLFGEHVRWADLIVVLNHGELVEHGTHEDLLQRCRAEGIERPEQLELLREMGG